MTVVELRHKLFDISDQNKEVEIDTIRTCASEVEWNQDIGDYHLMEQPDRVAIIVNLGEEVKFPTNPRNSFQWHDAKEELPEPYVDVLVVTEKGKYVVTSMYEHKDRTYWKSNWGGSITHWMYLPDLKGGKA